MAAPYSKQTKRLLLVLVAAFACISTTAAAASYKEIDVGTSHSCGVLVAGGINCWGDNAEGQLGDGTTKVSVVPVSVKGISNATAVSVGGDHTCALLSGGQIQCWGLGVIGDGATKDSTKPLTVAGIANATQVSTGSTGGCALLADGGVKCWGLNLFGELGNGSSDEEALAPVAVSDITDARYISAGNANACAVLASGAVRCWGLNSYGRAGTDVVSISNLPLPVESVSGAAAVSSGDATSCVLLLAGPVQCWGPGILGNGSAGVFTSEGTLPGVVAVSGISQASQISVEGISCALIQGGQVQCWGDNDRGQLGNGTTGAAALVPQTVSAVAGSSKISVGGSHVCVLDGAGAARCWGSNEAGQLGNGVFIDRSSPQPLLEAQVGAALAWQQIKGSELRQRSVRPEVVCLDRAKSNCRGSLRLIRGKKTLAKATYKAKRGKIAKVKLRLSKKVLKELKKKKSLDLTLVLRDKNNSAVISQTITLLA